MDVKNDPFFQGIDFDSLLELKIPPPHSRRPSCARQAAVSRLRRDDGVVREGQEQAAQVQLALVSHGQREGAVRYVGLNQSADLEERDGHRRGDDVH